MWSLATPKRCRPIHGKDIAQGLISLGRPKRVLVDDIMSVHRNRWAFDRRVWHAQPCLRAGAKRLRSSLHVLYYSLWPRQFAICACGRCCGSDQAAGRQGLQRGCSDGCRSHQLGVLICRCCQSWAIWFMRILKLVPDLPRLRISSIDSVEA